MSLVFPRGNMRWKEWLPLFSQQQRLRNLIQVIAYNINQDINVEKKRKIGSRYYYTLHLTTMSAPFYTSEKLDSENPKWSEVEITNPVFGAATGIVIRVWQNYNDEDKEVTVWGVYFSGLVYIGSQLSQANPATFCANTIVFYMHGGYFTDPQCFKGKSPFVVRLTSVTLPVKDVKNSYSVALLSKIHQVQHEIKKQSEVADQLRKQILAGGTSLQGSEIKESSNTLRKLLNQSKPPKPQYSEIIAVKKDIELVKFRVQLLSQEKSRKQAEIRKLTADKNALYEKNQDKGCELMEKYRELKRDKECLEKKRQECAFCQESLMEVMSNLSYRRKQHISQLSLIFPITRISEGEYAICGVHLPSTELLNGHNEGAIAVALGYVAHLVKMIAYFLHVPPRYPIIHFGSRSQIMDHIHHNMLDKDRLWPLFSRSKDKFNFNYGVWLLNKNIAQLRLYCGIPVHDLRPTLLNLVPLLQLRLGSSSSRSELSKRTASRSSAEIPPFPSPIKQLTPNHSLNTINSSMLSFSLDQGLDRWAESKKQVTEESSSLGNASSSFYSSSYKDTYSSNAQPSFFKIWQADHAICSDEEKHSSLPTGKTNLGNSIESSSNNNCSEESSQYGSLPHNGTMSDSNLVTDVSNLHADLLESNSIVNNCNIKLEQKVESTSEDSAT